MPTSCANSKTLGGCDKCGGKKQIGEAKMNNVKQKSEIIKQKVKSSKKK